jgi:nucleoside-diphosphate-sugar epimerase
MQKNVLVTGGTGFVGLHILYQLLQEGYSVRTTLRSLSKKNAVTDTLKANGITALDNLTFVEADLSKDDGWDAAMKDCDYVLSVASPVFFEKPKDENEAIRPAVEGITRVLKSARDANVRRVVMTSNFGAVGFSKTDPRTATTEDDWTNPNERGLSLYEKSKLLAERAAWDFIKREDGKLEFATVNPVAIWGLPLDAHVSDSFKILKSLLDGSMKAIPNFSLNVVDVRDVADLHIRAMTNPSAIGRRFIASADGQISMLEIASLIKEKRPDAAKNIAIKILPNWIVAIAGLFNEHAKEGALFAKMSRNVSNAAAKNILGWEPIATTEEVVLSAVDCMTELGII